jgi:hypothetical protein
MTDAVYFVGVPVLLGLSVWGWPRRDSRLHGTWRSNKEQTLARWRREAIFPPEVIRRLEDSLVTTTVTYAGRKVTTSTDDWSEVSKYRVLKSGKDYTVFELFSKVWNRHVRFAAFFVEDGAWIASDDIIKGYISKYDRIT